MTRRFIPVEEAAKEWFRDPEFRPAYDTLDKEFALAEALIKARTTAEMTQADNDSSGRGEGNGNHASGRCAAGKRSHHALDTHLAKVRRSDRQPPAYQLRTGENHIGTASRSTSMRVPRVEAS